MIFEQIRAYLICCRHSTAEAKQASFVVGNTCKKRIYEIQREKLSFAITIKIKDISGRVNRIVLGLEYYSTKVEMLCYLEPPTPKKSIIVEEPKIHYTFLVSPRTDKVTGQNFLQ